VLKRVLNAHSIATAKAPPPEAPPTIERFAKEIAERRQVTVDVVAVQNFGSVFVAAVREASERRAEQAAMTGLPVIDLTAEPIVEAVKHEPAGQQQTDW
jgi:hypothetical protein